MNEVHTRHVPERTVATIEGHTTAEALPDFIQTHLHRLFDVLSVAGLSPAGAPFVAYYGPVDAEADGPVEVCVPIDGTLEGEDDVRVRVEPAAQEAYVRLTKAQVAYPGILEAYQALEEYLTRTGATSSGAPREVYVTDWSAANPDDPACDVAWPIRAAEG